MLPDDLVMPREWMGRNTLGLLPPIRRATGGRILFEFPSRVFASRLDNTRNRPTLTLAHAHRTRIRSKGFRETRGELIGDVQCGFARRCVAGCWATRPRDPGEE